MLILGGFWDLLEVRKRQGKVLAHPVFNKDMPELTVATMLRDQTSYLSVDRASRGGSALRTSPGAHAESMSLLYPFMARVSSDHHR